MSRRRYGHAGIVADPWQTIGMLQRLRDRGVTVREWAFTSQSGGLSIPSVILANRQMGQLGRVSSGPRAAGLLNPAYLRNASRGTIADIAAVQRSQTAAQRRAGIGLVVPGSANDPSRVKRV